MNYNDPNESALFLQAINTEEGLKAIASQMNAPIQTSLMYKSIARKVLVPDPIAKGTLARYDLDITVPAVVVSKRGEVPDAIIQGRDFVVPTFNIAARVSVSMQEVQERMFNVIDRMQQQAKNDIARREDEQVFLAIDYAIPTSATNPGFNHLIASSSGRLTLDLLNAAAAKIERHNLKPSKIIMNSNRYADIRAWGKDYFDFVTQREVLTTGVFGQIWGYNLLESNIMPDNSVLVVADAEMVGVMPIRQEVTVVPADKPSHLQLGFVIYENIGICIANPKGISKIAL